MQNLLSCQDIVADLILFIHYGLFSLRHMSQHVGNSQPEIE
jgi:hypothetical protein